MMRVREKSLELTEDSRLSAEDCKALDRLSSIVRKEYDTFVSELININTLSNKDLFLKVSSRNSLVSEVLQAFCYLAFIEAKIKLNDLPERIILDSKEMKEAVAQLLNKYTISDIELVANNKKKIGYFVYFINLTKITYVLLNSWIFTRIFSTKRKPVDHIILVDTFLFKESIDEDGNFEDRYYTGHEKYLNCDEKRILWYAPTLYGLKTPLDYFKVFKRSLKLNKNFFIKESWLNFNDYFSCAYNSFLIASKVKKFPKFRGIDVSSIIKRELKEDIGSLAVFRAMCNYRFFRRLSEENIEINSVVNWFENHVNDRALNLSVKKYHQNTIIKGYQGFFLIDYYATYEPTELEYTLNTIPHELHVMNNFSYETIKKSCAKLNIKLSPAFRFDHLEKIKDKRSNNSKTIFIPFPGEGMTSRGVNLVSSCISAVEQIDENIKIFVKPHPSFPLKLLKSYNQIMTNQVINYTTENTSSMYEISDLVLAIGSVTCAEAIALGIPVAIGGNSNDITMNPIPYDFKSELWTVFYTDEELKKFMLFSFNLINRTNSIQSLFHPHTKEGAKSLFTAS